MSVIQRFPIDLAELGDLLPFSDFEQTLSAQEMIDQIDPKYVFDHDDMQVLRELIGDRINNIQSIDNRELSEVMYNAGFSPDDFDPELFELSAENIDKIATEIDQLILDRSGNSDPSTSFLNNTSDVQSFLTNSNIIAATAFVASVVANAEQYKKEAINQLDALDSVTMKDITEALDDAVNYTQNEIETIYDSTVTDISNIAKSIGKTVETSIENVSSQVRKRVDTLTTAIENLTADETSDLSATKKVLKKEAESVAVITEPKVAKVVGSTTTKAIDQHRLNVPDANTKDVSNYHKKRAAQTNRHWNDHVNNQKDKVVKKQQKVKAVHADIAKSSKDRSRTPGFNGRPVVKKDALITAANDQVAKNRIYTANDFGGPYSSEIAKRINTLHPSCRERFANALIDLTNDEKLIEAGITLTVTSATRTIAKQKQLYDYYSKRGTPVAYPGNSWHNYGCACDIAIFVNGVAKGKTSGYYKGFPRDYFAKYNINNPFRRDYIHFQPAELPLSPKQQKPLLLTDRGTVNQQAVSRLLA